MFSMPNWVPKWSVSICVLLFFVGHTTCMLWNIDAPKIAHNKRALEIMETQRIASSDPVVRKEAQTAMVALAYAADNKRFMQKMLNLAKLVAVNATIAEEILGTYDRCMPLMHNITAKWFLHHYACRRYQAEPATEDPGTLEKEVGPLLWRNCSDLREIEYEQAIDTYITRNAIGYRIEQLNGSIYTTHEKFIALTDAIHHVVETDAEGFWGSSWGLGPFKQVQFACIYATHVHDAYTEDTTIKVLWCVEHGKTLISLVVAVLLFAKSPRECIKDTGKMLMFCGYASLVASYLVPDILKLFK